MAGYSFQRVTYVARSGINFACSFVPSPGKNEMFKRESFK